MSPAPPPLAPVSFSQTLTTIASAAGTASVTFQAPNVRGGLTISTIDFDVDGSELQIPVCTASVNDIVLAVKRAGDRGQMIGAGDVLHLGQLLVLRWTNATPGARCSATLNGTGKR